MRIPLCLLALVPACATAAPSAYVDPEGVLRWTASHAEVVQFGTNYTAPFAYSFRAHARLGVPIEKAIDADTYHLARMGLDAYRVHVWDRQISDAAGNLLANEHLAAFDYLLGCLEARGFKIILTPLLFGDAGYPESRVAAEPGFSSRFGKQGSLENRDSWPLQERYLNQFVSHVNPRTHLALKDDPDIIGFEVCNEPGHFDYAPTLAYINTMVAAVRGAGCEKPVFYNMSHGLPVAQAYLDSTAQGGTFQWYPSGLVAGHEQRGNFLPYVDSYPIPFAADPKFRTKAKIVYEFDSADIGRSYLYPAMARSFRTAGMQFATQFAYDPLYLAPFNTEYQTHFLNLAYTPQKALSMKIAAEAFRTVPRLQGYGAYPADTAFAGIRLSYARDLAELATDRKFFYTNSTDSAPPAPGALEEVAGYGSSPIVQYPGRGAYFLDRISAGVWRLEVMPDALWVSDPFAKASPSKQVARIAWNVWPMEVRLPDLGDGFQVRGLNDGNGYAGAAAGRTVSVGPGAYLLWRAGLTPSEGAATAWRNIHLGEFVAPPPSIDAPVVIHTHAAEAEAGRDLRITATVALPPSGTAPTVALVAYPPAGAELRPPRPEPGQRRQPGGGFIPGPGAPESGGPLTLPMVARGLEYTAVVPGSALEAGEFRYFIVTSDGRSATTFPSGLPGRPSDWDFYGAPWKERIVPPAAPVLLFDATADTDAITYADRETRYSVVPAAAPGSSALRFTARDLDLGEHDASFRFFFGLRVGDRLLGHPSARTLVLAGRSATGAPCQVQVALVTGDGFAYGAPLTVGAEFGRYAVSVSALKPVRAPNLPHGYPVFIPFWSPRPESATFDARSAESLLLSLGPGLGAAALAKLQGVDIERVWLE